MVIGLFWLPRWLLGVILWDHGLASFLKIKKIRVSELFWRLESDRKSSFKLTTILFVTFKSFWGLDSYIYHSYRIINLIITKFVHAYHEFRIQRPNHVFKEAVVVPSKSRHPTSTVQVQVHGSLIKAKNLLSLEPTSNAWSVIALSIRFCLLDS